ncbi:GGDEF domain-containing protein [Exilibacterium tricleocarpae]|uniref:diguanylate cyclase n=1 Tax=Exilibacterium tricleocarpae TaxID=2591008 RepID=A0A545TM59_9GAMM|nr:GGDEF domain-containing protein [Exilibacterium tricleocarpae]TQV78266.1 GGDEF domain-containing protein [Exilibacterium tricleocarpae]
MVTPVQTSPTALIREDNIVRARMPSPRRDRDEARAHLTSVLQTTLDLTQLVNLFFESLQDVVSVSGLTYTHAAHAVQIQTGKACVHSSAYRLITPDDNLGEIVFTRGRRFKEQELTVLEFLIGTLLYPLRNALKYREAINTALQDPLTGAGNRAAMQNTLDRELRLARRYRQALSLLVIDIDHFKSINDRLGHSGGDQVLREVAQQIGRASRETDLTFRYGGEEFVVVLSNTGESGAATIAERVRQGIDTLAIRLKGDAVHTTVSVGCSTLTAEDDIASLFERADKALYKAKQKGRNRVVAG